MSCQGCVGRMRRAVVAGDEGAEVSGDPASAILTVTSRLPLDDILQRLDEAGYPAQPMPTASTGAESESTETGSTETGSKETKSTETNPSEASASSHGETSTVAPEPSASSQAASSDAGASKASRLAIHGMTCAGCVASVQKALAHTPGVEQADVNFASHTARVRGSVDPQALVQAVESVGYGATPIVDLREAEKQRAQRNQRDYRRMLKGSVASLGLAVPLMIMMLIHHPAPTGVARLGWGLVGLATLAVLIGPGRQFFRGAWKALRHHQANMDTLIALGTGTAWLYSMVVVLAAPWLPEAARGLYFEASAMVIGLVLLGKALELRAQGHTSEALHRLLDLQSQTARLVTQHGDQEVAIDDVTEGDLIRVRPGERLPVDGQVTEGSSYIDESMLSGEPAPVARGPGDEVSAGTVNGRGSLVFRATRIGADTRLGRITEQVTTAQGSKPPIGNLADRVSAVFVPSVMIIAVLTALAWYHLGPEPAVIHMLVTATTVLIIACPCALGLATPLSTMIGVGKAADHGVLIRSGEALQTASTLTTLVVDKTGTLTEGRPRVTDVHWFDSRGLERSSLLALVAEVESRSEHPVGEALARFAEQQAASAHHGDVSVDDFESITGQGVKARTAQGPTLAIGNGALMEAQGVDLHAVVDTLPDWQQQARTLVYAALDDQLTAAFAIEDPLRQDSRDAIARLQADGIKVVMLTGDNAATATAIGEAVGIDEVHAELSPSDKHADIERRQAQGEIVGMAGDGINDAPALARANVGFAMGQGTDVAIESAGITLMRPSLHGIAAAIEISQATLSNIRQNLWGALGYNVLCIPIAAGLLYPLTGTLLSPMIAGAAMSASSITVVANANRLRLKRLQGAVTQPSADADSSTASGVSS
ncbi:MULTISPECIES: heavy metal translocating P-type ATPase [unclassified Halomonas]|uniref:heavy metal translocating P-type ATPase n=1 Tax=unclassified Halomonas TaxID=2609666 RepID=UPI001C96EEA9|nr:MULTISPECIES: heavy metal translocating P-type ATPase [unclassified Halomonas]MBY5926489.1 heavy metal translocating P-type ATPase [Halomonas sp. DP4Y7-2]MBY6233531.1 heavy metal translocating P-type ATPase [Halomonas sp. DP4Y7-1]